jgi:organic radical activating enzyme
LALKLSEIFDSVQGEGPSAGKKATFLRLALCNLRCVWCDTKYTWDFTHYDYEREVSLVSVDDVAEELGKKSLERLIVTGGEPLLQQAALEKLFELFPRTLPIELETNGTLQPAPALLDRVDQWNVSPKLENSGEPERRRIRREVLASLRATGRAWLKLVVKGSAERAAIEQLLTELGWPRELVLLMPEAARRDEYALRLPIVGDLAEKLGLRVSPRLHVELWDGERGR